MEYIVQLLDEAAVDLPDIVQFEIQEAGRITKPIALSVKALVLVTAASPLFNGNADYPNFVNSEGTPFFNPNYQKEKWEKAAHACREAIDLCHSLGLELDRKSVVWGKSVSVRVDLGGRGIITKKKQT